MAIDRTAHTFTAEPATSTLMNAEVKALWDGLQDSWDAYTPTWSSTGTAPTLGDGGLTGRWIQIGKTIHWRISFSFGSTSTAGTGFYRFTLPDSLDWNEHDAIGSGTVLDASTTTVYGFTAVYDGSGRVRGYFSDGTKVGATTPLATLNTGDRITISGHGELA